MIFFFHPVAMVPLFDLDLTTSTERALEIEWTERPVEDGATITDYRIRKPETFPLEGVITAWPWTGYDPGRLQAVDRALRQLALDGQPVLMVTDTWSEEVVISRVASVRPEDEDLIRVSIECRMIETIKPETASVPAARMKPGVRPGAAPAPKASASGTVGTPGPSTSASAYNVDWDALTPGRGSAIGPGIAGGLGL